MAKSNKTPKLKSDPTTLASKVIEKGTGEINMPTETDIEFPSESQSSKKLSQLSHSDFGSNLIFGDNISTLIPASPDTSVESHPPVNPRDFGL